MTTIYGATIYDDRGCPFPTIAPTRLHFSSPANRLKSVAEWIMEDMETALEEEEEARQNLSALHEAGRYQELLDSYLARFDPDPQREFIDPSKDSDYLLVSFWDEQLR